MAFLWMDEKANGESDYTKMREDEVTALRRRVKELEEELWWYTRLGDGEPTSERKPSSGTSVTR